MIWRDEESVVDRHPWKVNLNNPPTHYKLCRSTPGKLINQHPQRRRRGCADTGLKKVTLGSAKAPEHLLPVLDLGGGTVAGVLLCFNTSKVISHDRKNKALIWRSTDTSFPRYLSIVPSSGICFLILYSPISTPILWPFRISHGRRDESTTACTGKVYSFALINKLYLTWAQIMHKWYAVYAALF